MIEGKFKKILFFVFISIFILSFSGRAFSYDIVPQKQYLAYARASADWIWQNYDQVIEKWKQRLDPENFFGYRPPGGLLEMAVIYSYLFEKEKNPEYSTRAKKVLLTYGDFRSFYPESSIKKRTDYTDGVPVLPDFFTAMRYIRAYNSLNRLGVFKTSEKQKIETVISKSMQYLLRTQEWGPMNRAALRAESLAWAVRALPHHHDAKIWEVQRKALGDDNWGNWEIEDASLYHGVWLYSLLGYADAMGKLRELFKTPEMYYYAHYFLHLLSPAGMIPDFGDAHLFSNWNRFLVFFEAAANQYQDPNMKWAASTISRKFIDFQNPTNVGLGYMLLDCYRWGSAMPASPPTNVLSEEVMEDVVGKKIVFRNGWDARSTYLLLNYRDEGDGGLLFRDYLRDTLPVEEEKMTHGHSDENSIVLLMSKGSILLHDGGYRNYMPSGPFGAYRQDYFHNRLCVRPEKIWMGQKKGEFRYSIYDTEVLGQNILDFLHNAGSYRRVRTQKIDFLSFPDFDYSRTRLIDQNMGYEWDRVITYIKGTEIFVVFDIFKAQKEEFFTLSNLWHTRKILSKGEHWYDTVYDKIQNHDLPQDKSLLIFFPLTHYKLEGIEPQNRHFQDELLIHQTTAQHFELGETVGFITVLIPHSSNEPPEELIKRISLIPVQPQRYGMGVQIQTENGKITVGVKNNLRMDICRDWRRPRYTYESGRLTYGEFETNGDFIFASECGTKLNYTIVNLTKAFFKGKLLTEAQPSLSRLAFDGSPAKA
ncbi:MAG: hypothetical protein IBX60_04605, partial [Candidatus Aminicenantes bacterium]|nr:hypothetical protein [Candidatus Aminicenantes bacterium]